MTSSTDLVKAFNFLNFKKIVTMKELKPNTDYAVSGAYRTTTKYGEKIVLKLEDGILYLPSRYNSLGDDALTMLCSGLYSVMKTQLREGLSSTLYKIELKQSLPTDTYYAPYLD